MDILGIDIETLPHAGFFWGLHKQNISHQGIIKESSVVCASWMLVDRGRKPRAVSILDDEPRYKKSVYDDEHVIRVMAKRMDDADILLAQNGDSFDIKILRWKMCVYGLPPLRPIQTIDTLKESRKVFRPASHRLDFKSHVHGLGGKEDVGGFKTWVNIAMRDFGGDDDAARKAIKKMVKYNKKDVLDLEGTYLKERAHYKGHPNRLLYDSLAIGCPTCGSKDFVGKGYRYNVSGVYRGYLCRSCGKRFQDSHRSYHVTLKN